MNFELILSNFSNYFLPFESIKSNEFRTNPASEKFDSTLLLESNRTNFELFFTFKSIESNRTNFKRMQHLKNLTPLYSWSRIERITNQFSSNFSNIFCLFESIELQIFELNEFRTNSNSTPPLNASLVLQCSKILLG